MTTAEELEGMSREKEREAFLEKKQALSKSKAKTSATVKAPPTRRSKWWPPSVDAILVWGVGVALVVALIIVSSQEEPNTTRLFTNETLRRYNGLRGRPMYLAILGQVYDVTKGKHVYGEGKSYSFFVGRDASRAFVTGDFKGDGLTDNVEGLTNEQMASLGEWTRFYHKEYIYKGRLIGAFYTSDGKPTQMLRMVQQGAKAAKTADELRREEEARFPKCTVRWSEQDGGHVSCEGEDLRPRKIFVQLPGGKPTTRCACMEGSGWSDVRQVYPGCSPSAQTCQVSAPTKS